MNVILKRPWSYIGCLWRQTYLKIQAMYAHQYVSRLIDHVLLIMDMEMSSL